MASLFENLLPSSNRTYCLQEQALNAYICPLAQGRAGFPTGFINPGANRSRNPARGREHHRNHEQPVQQIGCIIRNLFGPAALPREAINQLWEPYEKKCSQDGTE